MSKRISLNIVIYSPNATFARLEVDL